MVEKNEFSSRFNNLGQGSSINYHSISCSIRLLIGRVIKIELWNLMAKDHLIESGINEVRSIIAWISQFVDSRVKKSFCSN